MNLVATIQVVAEVEDEATVAAVMLEAVAEAVAEEEATTTDPSTMLSPRTSRAAMGNRWIMMTPIRRSARVTTLPYQHPAVPAKDTMAAETRRPVVLRVHRVDPWVAKQLTTAQIYRITIRDSLRPLLCQLLSHLDVGWHAFLQLQLHRTLVGARMLVHV
jgi:hypothetical protein